MKIGFVLPNLKTGGGNRAQIMLANGLLAKGHEVSIIVPKGLVSKVPSQINAKIVEVGLPLSRAYLVALFNYPLIGLSLGRYEAVIVTFSIIVWFTFFFTWLFGTKFFYFARSYDPLILDQTKIGSRFLLWLYKFVARLSYALPLKLVVNSKWTGQMIAKNTLKKISYQVVNNGVDLSVFNCSQQCKRDGQRKYKQILVLGKTQEYKGLDDLYVALDILAQKDYKFKLIIMTPDKLTLPQNLSFRAELVYPKDDVAIANAYRAADVFVSPSWYEGFCNPPLEAMACGTPVALTDSGGVREYAIHRYNCLMSPPKKTDELADNINLLLTDEILAANLVQNGLDTACKFTWDRSVEELEKILEVKCNRRSKDENTAD